MPLEDIPEHDLIMIVGSNPAETLPIIMNYLLAAKRAGTKFIVVDPRKTTTANLATLHLSVKLGGDLALANLLLKRVLEQNLENHSFISERTRDFGVVKDQLSSLSTDSLVAETGCRVKSTRRGRSPTNRGQNPPYFGWARSGPERSRDVKHIGSYQLGPRVRCQLRHIDRTSQWSRCT